MIAIYKNHNFIRVPITQIKLHIWTFFRFVLFLLQKSLLALYFQRWAHFYMHKILSQLTGISALKPGLRNIGNSQRNRQKNVEKLRQRYRQKTWCVNSCFSKGFRHFLSDFSIFLKTSTKYYAYVPSVESNKLLKLLKQ